jgi:hypothetical protein
MPESHNRAVVRRVLDELKPYLVTYVDQRLAGNARARRPTRPDLAGYLSSMLENWEIVFARVLSASTRHYIFELKEIRNRWAHEEEFADEEARRAADTARLIAKAIESPREVVNRLAELARFERQAQSAPARPSTRESSPRIAPGSATRPRVDAHGVIVNAAELTAADLAGKRVLCPGCGEKVFEMWPGGWDAHAAHLCRGALGATDELRKADFRKRFDRLFRGSGLAAAPSKQRDVMRKLWVKYGPDEDRVIREYAAAEQRGEVGRARNAYAISAEEYARRLLSDGLRKGWLPERRPS